MPGSREGEIRRLLPAFAAAARQLRLERPGLDVVLVKADSVPDALLAKFAGEELRRWSVVTGPHLSLLAASDVLVVASGTATVEGLLAGIPMVVAYRVNPVSYLLGKILIKVPDVAMANIVSDDGSGTRAVPELIQREARPGRIVEEVSRLLDEPARAAEARRRLALGRADLGPEGAAGRTADAVVDLLPRRGA